MKIFQCRGCVGIDQEPDVQPENEALLKIFWRVLFQVSCKDDKVTIPEQKVFFVIQDVKIFAFPIAARHFPFCVPFNEVHRHLLPERLLHLHPLKVELLLSPLEP